MCGQVAGLVQEILPVDEIITGIMAEAGDILQRLGRRMAANKQTVGLLEV